MENLQLWSERMQVARLMLCAIIQQSHKFILDNQGKDSKVYHDAIVRMVLDNLDNTQKFLQWYKIAYRNHKRTEKGKLVSVEAYFIN